jgi:hypothetical protein
VSAQDGEVSCLYCRFALCRDTPCRLERWEWFMQDLCGAFGLAIAVADAEAVGPECFLGILQQADNWRYFAEHFGWDEPSHE